MRWWKLKNYRNLPSSGSPNWALNTKYASFGHLLEGMVKIFLLERICLERAFQRIRLRNRCNPCRMEPLAQVMYDLSDPDLTLGEQEDVARWFFWVGGKFNTKSVIQERKP